MKITGTEEEEYKHKGPQNVFKKIIEKLYSMPKEGDSYKGTRNIMNIKEIGPRKKVPLPHKNQNTKQIEKRIKQGKQKQKQVTYKSKPNRITPEFSRETQN